MNLEKENFGNDFHWGVATAAYQIEGAHETDGKGHSIWDEFSNKSKKIKDRTTGNIACDHYNRYKEDLDLIKQLNFANYRFSLAWSRIKPNGIGQTNQKGIDFYNRLIDSSLEIGLTPWVTLYHWDLPLALQKKGGWINRDILNWFGEYVETSVKHFGDRVTNWMVINEPMVFTGAGYFLGYHAPGKRGLMNFIPAMHHTALAHGIGGRIIRDLVPNANIGSTFSCSHIEPYSLHPRNIAAAQRFDALLNRLYIEPILGLGYPLATLPSLRKVEKFYQPNDESLLPFDFDFIGIQNYTREVVRHSWFVPYVSGKMINAAKRGKPTTTMGWEVYPESVYHMLHQFAKYDAIKKLIITESGAAFPDDLSPEKEVSDHQRMNYFKDVLCQILKAKQEGIAVNGYFIWTLLDNFEWSEGYTQRFGLVYNNHQHQERIVKQSGLWFKNFLASSELKEVLELEVKARMPIA